VDAPQAVDVEAETSLSQQFRLAPIPQWSVFEDMLNELGRTGQFLQGNTVEPVAQVTSQKRSKVAPSSLGMIAGEKT
jgi:hypothetical protein